MKHKIDLHLHTTASDGKLSPSELVALAVKENLSYIAVTDHDTTKGLSEALKSSRNSGITVFPGIELSTQKNGENVHILGYFNSEDYLSDKFQGELKSMEEHRKWRSRKIIENLKKYFDISLNYENILNKAKGVIGRPHIARAILEAGYDFSWEYIFDKLIGNDSPAYVPNKNLSPKEGLRLLKSAGAITVLAHPVLVKQNSAEDLLALDFDGIEAIYSLNEENDTKNFVNLAIKNNKIITCGSDYHGGDIGDTKHGYIGSLEYPENYFNKFKNNFLL
ncbi:PHP domain-containing protein [Clostridium sp. 19966]|uniref:PHP domain-containing protein n=1 Tax=Clostridium sp. 19966 TaxID=2768166 RepID=UPI0028DFE501|nr:PHP domain-containing protein [Clostridium sp. 19966]MDT8715223.1 PHP domain-containing protein [Clostridium sp. 19966]